MRCSLADSEVRKIIAALDVNGDGSVDWEEFVGEPPAFRCSLLASCFLHPYGWRLM